MFAATLALLLIVIATIYGTTRSLVSHKVAPYLYAKNWINATHSRPSLNDFIYGTFRPDKKEIQWLNSGDEFVIRDGSSTKAIKAISARTGKERIVADLSGKQVMTFSIKKKKEKRC